MKKILIILGPTATGKTDLALQLASKFQGELVACDSRQVYKGLDIGTGKLPSEISNFEIRNSKLKKSGKATIPVWNRTYKPGLEVRKGKGFWEIGGIRVWMYDVVSPKTQYTVADYIKDAGKVVEEINGRGKLPIVVGGTGLYLRGLLDGLSNLAIPVDKKLRKQLERLSVEELQNRLRSLSPSRWEELNQSDRQNSRRLLRSIELVMTNPYRKTSEKWKVQSEKSNLLKIGLTAPRDELYVRADLRVLSWIDQDIINEVERLHKSGINFKRLRQLGLEYGVLADFLDGKIKTKDELVKIMEGKIHGYVRRQLTWFKKEKDMNWFDVEDNDFADKVENLVSRWYDSAKKK